MKTQAEPYEVLSVPASIVVGLKIWIISSLHSCMLKLVSPFHDDPVVRMHFWQRAMPRISEWLQQLHKELAIEPDANPWNITAYISTLSKRPSMNMLMNVQLDTESDANPLKGTVNISSLSKRPSMNMLLYVQLDTESDANPLNGTVYISTLSKQPSVFMNMMLYVELAIAPDANPSNITVYISILRERTSVRMQAWGGQLFGKVLGRCKCLQRACMVFCMKIHETVLSGKQKIPMHPLFNSASWFTRNVSKQ